MVSATRVLVLPVAVCLAVMAARATIAGAGAAPAGDPTAADPPSGPMSVIVGVDPDQLTCLIGGAVGGDKLRAEDLFARLRDGQTYRLYNLKGAGEEVISIGRPKFEGSEGECIDLWRQELSLDPRAEPGFSVALQLPGGAGDPVPAPLEVLDEPLPEHVEMLRDFLARRDVPDPEPEFEQVIRTDIDGDGTPEYILNLVRIGSDHARKGDHSIILVVRGEGAASRTYIVQEEVDLEDSEFPSTLWINTIAAVLDIDGDGTAEIITEGGYLYGGGWEVIRWDGNAYEHVLFCGCDG